MTAGETAKSFAAAAFIFAAVSYLAAKTLLHAWLKLFDQPERNNSQ